MTRALAIRLLPEAAVAVVVRGGAEPIAVEAVRSVPLDPDGDAASRGRAIAEALHDLRISRLPAVLAIPRADLSLLSIELPPAPEDDLADLVHLQALRDLPLADDGEGFDFLPLEGGDDQPWQVLGVGLLTSQWKTMREVCQAAELRLERIVPEPLGWPELGRRVATGSDDGAGLRLCSSIIERQAVIWATERDRLRLIRAVWLPEDENAAADAAALGLELRRTLLALAQSPSPQGAAVKCIYIGVDAEEIAGELSATLSKPVHAAPLERLVDLTAGDLAVAPAVEAAPLAALAAALAERRPAPIDLLHPRRRPAPPSRRRTYVLAATAALALAALGLWTAYRGVQEPLEAAESARAQQHELSSLLESLAADEAKAQSVREWLGQSANLLEELDALSQQLRPEPLSSDKFSAEQDIVLKKLTFANGRLTLDAAAKSDSAVPVVESRLRSAGYRVDRGPVQTGVEGPAGYAVSVSSAVQRSTQQSQREASHD
ncbi:MAG: hypothetical protein DCC67_13380 [Planctomycetota bacterium]|nr:MAG: hypothetical protein DCC67_13380 [Planctomycetota bacterium]